MTTLKKTDRMETRLTAEQKQLFERAAFLEGRTLTDYVIATLQDAARETIESYEVLKLTEAERDRFFAALSKPPKPNEALRATAKSYKKLIIE